MRDNRGRLFAIAAATISRYERYSQKFIMRANISRGDATNVNPCRQLQVQFTRHARPSRPIGRVCLHVSADRGEREREREDVSNSEVRRQRATTARFNIAQPESPPWSAVEHVHISRMLLSYGRSECRLCFPIARRYRRRGLLQAVSSARRLRLSHDCTSILRDVLSYA